MTFWSMYDNLKSYFCRRTVHCEPLIILYLTHQMYWLVFNPHYFRPIYRFLQSSSVSWRVIYRDLFSLAYITGFSFSMMIYFWYSVSYSFIISSDIAPYSHMHISSSTPMCINSLGVFPVAMPQTSLESMMHDRIRYYVPRFGALVWSFSIYSHCLCPWVHMWNSNLRFFLWEHQLLQQGAYFLSG